MRIFTSLFSILILIISVGRVLGQSDNCSGATTLTVNAGCSFTSGSSSGATQSLPGCAGTADDDVWYKFVAGGTSQQITVAPSASYDPVVELLSGSCSSPQTSLYCVDNGLMGENEVINATGLTSGATYYIRVYHYYSGSGSNTFQICVNTPPAAPGNNTCATATTLSVNTTCTTTTGTTLNATMSQSGCVGTANDDVWYKFVANNTSQTITVDPSTNMDAVLEIFSGSCGTLTSLYCIDDGFTDGNESVVANGLTIGATYYIRVYDYYAGSGSPFTICVTGTAASGTPNNDALCSAFIWPTVTADCNYLQFTTTGGTTSAAAYIPVPASCGGTSPYQGGYVNPGTKDVWFKIQVPSNGALSISDNPNFAGISDGVMALYSTANPASCTATLTQIACNDDGGVGTHPLLNVTGLTPGSYVYLRYWAYGSGSGNFQLCVSSPTNDNCNQALYICDLNGYSASTSAAYTDDSSPSGNGEMYGNNESSTGVPDAPNTDSGGPFGTNLDGSNGSAAGPSNYDVTIDNASWIIFTASASTAVLNVTVSDCWYNNGMQMQIFSGTNCTNFVAVSDFKESPNGTFTLSASGLTVGQNYYLVVDGFAGDVCNYTISANSGVQFPGITSNKDAVCIGDSVTLTGPSGATDYQWLPGGQTTQSITVTPATTMTYYCIAGGVCGYKQTLSKQIVVNPIPSPTITGSASVCATGSNTYSVSSVAGNTYNWTVTGGSIASGQGTNSININWGSGASGSVSVTQTVTATGCANNAIKNVTINPLPNPVVSPATAVCANSTGNIYSTTNNSGNTYSWTVTGGTISSGQGTNSITVSWASSGTGTVSVTETITATGCSKSSSQNITINPLPAPAISPTSAVCASSTGNVYSTSNVAGHSYSWSISGGTITSGAATSSVTVNWGSSGTGTLTLLETITATGCSKTVSQNITINPNPSPSISGLATVCASSSGITYSVSNTAGNSYSWTVTGGSVSSGQGTNSINVAWGAGASGIVNITETATATGCNTTVSFPVTINPLPTPNITGVTTVCANTAGSGYSVANSGNNFGWSVSGGSIAAGQGSSAVQINWGAAGSASVTIVETNPSTGCSNIDIQAVTINPNDDPSFNYSSATYCQTAANPSANITGGASGTFSATPAGLVFSNSSTGLINLASSALNTYTVTFTTNGTCPSGSSINITITNAPDATFSYVSPYCQYDTISTTPTVVNAGVFSSTPGLVFLNTNTGELDLMNSAPGTYTVTNSIAAGSSGCAATSSTNTITINPAPTPSINGSNAVCANQSGSAYSVTNVGGNTYSWTVSGGAINSGQNTNAVIIDWAGSGGGTVSITETITATGCSNSNTANITINPLPVPVISGISVICANSYGVPYSITNSANSSYVWSVAGGTLAGGQGTNAITVDWLAGASGMITLTETDLLTGCSEDTGLIVTINVLPSAVIAGPDSVCSNTTAVNYNATNNSNYSYNWTTSGATIQSGQSTTNITVDWGSSNGSVDVIITDNTNGCQLLVPYPVVVNPAVTPSVNGNVVICSGNNVAYTTVNNSGNTYSWTVSGGSINSGQGTNTIDVNWANAGSGTVSVTETNPLTGCMGLDIYNVNINATPATAISGTNPVCATATGVNYSVPLTTDYSYSWTVSGGTLMNGQAANSINVDWLNVSSGTITLTQTDTVTGCTADTTMIVTINALPLSVISGDAQVCPNSTGIPYTATGGNAYSYSWTVANGSIQSGQNTDSIYVDWSNASSGNINLNVLDVLTGCQNNFSYPIVINPVVSPAISGTATACQNGSNIYSTTQNTNSTYVWTFTGGSITSGQNTNSVNLNWGASGTLGLTVIETDTVTGCQGTDTYSITVNPLPGDTIGGSQAVCAFAGNINYQVPFNSNYVYSWTVSGGNIINGQNTNSINVNWAAANGMVTLTETDNSTGCTGTVMQVILVNPLPDPQITGDSTVCNNTAGLVYSIPNTGNSYNWSAINGTIGAGQGTNQATIDWSGAAGQLTVTETNSSTGCANSDTMQIILFSNPSLVTSGAVINNAECSLINGTITNVFATGGNPGYVYTWLNSANDTILISSGNADLTNVAAGNYSLFVSDTNACSGGVPASFTVGTGGFAIADFNVNATNGAAPLQIIFTNESINAGIYSWNFGDGSDPSVLTDPKHLFMDAGQYTVVLTASNAAGCTDTASIIINIDWDKDVFIPNVFSPNNDGLNDIFKVKSHGWLTDASAVVYNRWGQLIYEWKGIDGGWDGHTQAGQPSGAGVYFYLITTIDRVGQETIYKGTVTLVR